MTRQEIVTRIAESFYIYRQREDIAGDSEGDWRFAERAVEYFEDEDRARTSQDEIDRMFEYKEEFFMFKSLYLLLKFGRER